MGSADCLYYMGLVKTPEKLFKRKLGPLQDTLKAGGFVFPPFQISHDHMVKNQRSIPPVPAFGSIWVVLLAIFFQACSLYVHTKDRSPSLGHFWESLVI